MLVKVYVYFLGTALLPVVAVLVGADERSSALDEQAAALRTLLLDRFVPIDLVALRIAGASIEGLAFAAVLDDDVTAALRAFDAC